ncbi:MAG: HD domain-containing protein [Candidatus Anaerobiospirillum merdipullorum]|uniref:HD domain-containing protein n=1 Tax=Candidatus Anaerobiospirillum merdipullorum TaxID=2838450 RepID=A0A9E2KMZ8_9GAMM|nr:HD domain-containing protein [Candidatus Anaerobiospirillum merdipullorum]
MALTATAQIIERTLWAMMDYYRADPKRIQHFIKVHAFARSIGISENLDAHTQYIVELAALVHDIGIKKAEEKYGSSMGKYQEELGPQEAQALLTKIGVAPTDIERICYLVGHHHTYRNIDGIDLQILVEADFIVNIYEDGLAPKAANSVLHKIFTTPSGKRMLCTCFGLDECAIN